MPYRKPRMRSVRNPARIFESAYGMISIDVLTHLARLFVPLLNPLRPKGGLGWNAILRNSSVTNSSNSSVSK
jgi:hypothetical protein